LSKLKQSFRISVIIFIMSNCIHKGSLDVVGRLEVEPDRISYVKVDYLPAGFLVFAGINDNVADSILHPMCPI
jgi:hypothetical protein